jgi:hypothetical protein
VNDEQRESDLDDIANNPAGRVLRFLRAFERLATEMKTSTTTVGGAADVVEKLTGESQEKARMYTQLTRLWMQAESVPDLLKPYAGDSEYRMFSGFYGQILDAISYLAEPSQHTTSEILGEVEDVAWAALEYADSVLSKTSTEKRLSADQQQQYLDDLRGLIDDVLNDDTISPQDRQRVVGLLRQVEEALVDIRFFGADRVQDAAAAAAGVLHADRDLWDRIAKKKWIKRLGTVIGALLFTLGSMEGLPAIEQMFTPERPPIVIVQQDQNGQHVDQPTDEPTRR